MTAPMRRFLLNRQIALEARRIAHAATKTCRNDEYRPGGSDHDDEHTPRCNTLKRAIETLALQIKLAAVQQPEVRQQPAQQENEKEIEQEDRHGGCV